MDRIERHSVINEIFADHPIRGEVSELFSMYDEDNIGGFVLALDHADWLELQGPGKFILIKTGYYIRCDYLAKQTCLSGNKDHCVKNDTLNTLYLVSKAIWNRYKDDIRSQEAKLIESWECDCSNQYACNCKMNPCNRAYEDDYDATEVIPV